MAVQVVKRHKALRVRQPRVAGEPHEVCADSLLPLRVTRGGKVTISKNRVGTTE